MTTAIKRRRGTTTQHSTFTGLEGELTVDTTKDTVVVHDGATAGGIPLLREDLSNNTAVVKNNVSNTFSTSQIISANTSTDALRITQTGTGNALVVEDSANPDATPFVITGGGNVIQGTTSSTLGGAVEPWFGMVGANAYGPQFIIENKVNDVSAGYTVLRKNRNGAIVVSGDSLGSSIFQGYDGTNYIQAASIYAQVDGTPGTNDMPGRLVFSTTADGASSPTERMRIGSNGTFGYNIANEASVGQHNYFAALSGTNVYGNLNTLVAASGTTASIRGFNTSIGTAAASFTLGTSYHYLANQGTIGAGSAITNQYGYAANPSLTGATNNYGFYSNIAAGTGRYNFYAAGTADNYFAGNVGIGSVPFSGRAVYLSKTVAGSGGYGWAFDSRPTFDTATTVQGINYFSNVSTQDGSNVPSVVHFSSQQGTISGGTRTAPTTQYGFFAESSLTGATNNYGFYSNIAAGTGRWNFYAAGTANNYFAGSIGVGNTSPDSKLHVSNASTVLLTIENTSSATGFLVFRNTTQTANAVRIGSDANDFVAYTGTIERLRIDSSGNILNVSTGGLGYGTGSGGAVTQTTSRTQGVTLNRTNGAITLVSAAGSATTQSFTVTNSTVAATDTIIVNQKSGTDLYEIHITAVAAGSFRISFKTTGGTTTEQPVFNFAVIKAVTA